MKGEDAFVSFQSKLAADLKCLFRAGYHLEEDRAYSAD